MKRFFWFCSGANTQILENCPESEQTKFVGVGATVFFTALLASISGGYALFTVFEQWIPAFIFGIVWGLCIFNLDRFIVSTLKKNGSFWSEFRQASPRIILALIIAIVISKPIELKVFEKEINQTLDKKKGELALEQFKLTDKKFTEIDSLKNEVAKLKNEVNLKTASRDTLYGTIITEAEGRSVTNKIGKGPVYKEKREQFDKAEQELADLKTNNQSLIVGLQSKIAFLDSLKTSQKAKEQSNINEYDGLMARLNALDKLPKTASIFIMLLFMCIETAPIFTKLMSQKGPYDDYLKEIEHHIEMDNLEKMAERNLHTNKKIMVLNYLEEIDIKTDLEKGDSRDKVEKAHQNILENITENW